MGTLHVLKKRGKVMRRKEGEALKKSTIGYGSIQKEMQGRRPISNLRNHKIGKEHSRN